MWHRRNVARPSDLQHIVFPDFTPGIARYELRCNILIIVTNATTQSLINAGKETHEGDTEVVSTVTTYL